MAASIKSEELAKRNVRKRVRIKGKKLCQVCGDNALAHHFGALTCETCKAFFRRNALRQSEVKPCSEGQACQIDKNTRRMCPWCRLKKCFDVGMKAELIFGEGEKKDLVEKVKKNKMVLHKTRSSATTETSGGETTTQPHVTSSPVPVYVSQALPTLQTESGGSTSSGSTPGKADSRFPQDYSIGMNQSHFICALTGQDVAAANSVQVVGDASDLEHLSAYSVQIPDITSKVQQPLTAGTGKHGGGIFQNKPSTSCSQSSAQNGGQADTSSNQEATCAEQRRMLRVDLQSLTRDDLPSDPHMHWRLSEDERTLLSQLSVVYEDTVLANLKKRNSTAVLDSSSFTISDFLKECDENVRQAVSFVKSLDDFQTLNLDDQIACFKSTIGTAMHIRSAYTFVAERNAWVMKNGEMTQDLCKILIPCNPYLSLSGELCRELKATIKNDVTIYALLHCIVLFSPSSESVSDRQHVGMMRDKYVVLLRHYLEATFSFVYSEDFVGVLQNLVQDVQALHRASAKISKETTCCGSKEYVSFDLLMELYNTTDG